MVKIEAVSKHYGHTCALDNVTVHVPPAGITAILGPSGSGKTTLLNVCAGVVVPSAGRVFIGDDDVTDWPIEARDIGIVFQGYSLFPHLSVLENVAFPLRTRRHRVSRETAFRRADSMLGMVGLRGYDNRRPKELSGGQQQRVALARALVFNPRLLLLDEPLTALDPVLREQLQQDIKRLRDELGVTVLYVTHNVTEALVLADRIVILHEGRVLQAGTPRELYERPHTAMAATFIGEANFAPGVVHATNGSVMEIDAAGGRIRVPYSGNGSSGAVNVMVRPEKVRIATAAATVDENVVRGVVRRAAFLGSQTRISVELSPGVEWRVYVPSTEEAIAISRHVELHWRIDDTVMLKSNGDIGLHGHELPVGLETDRIA